MKEQRILKFTTSLIFAFLVGLPISAQTTEPNTPDETEPSVVVVTTDTIAPKDRYGLRIGLDAAKLVRTAIDDNYSGFELVGDFRLNKNWYVATEIGTEERTTEEEVLTNTANGTYLKVGLDYNMYTNFLGLENMIYVGFRAGGSTFSQTLERFETYNTNRYFDPQFVSTEPIEFDGLTAFWAELQFGIKAELFNNLYLGVNLQLKVLANEDEPENYQNLYIPGFNKTFDSGSFGFGYGYTISYFIPIFKK